MITSLKLLNALVSFLLELCMLAAFAYWAYQLDVMPLVKYLLVVGLPAVAIALWAHFAAPTSRNRLRMPRLMAFQVSMFALGAIALYYAGNTTGALLMSITIIVNAVCIVIWKQQ